MSRSYGRVVQLQQVTQAEGNRIAGTIKECIGATATGIGLISSRDYLDAVEELSCYHYS